MLAAKRLRPPRRPSWTSTATGADDAADVDEEVEIPSRGVRLQAQLHLPVPARAVVLFAHGSGSSRHSPRNRFVAERAAAGRPRHAAAGPADAGGGTQPRQRLRHRTAGPQAVLGARTGWPPGADTASCAIGYFGASTGAGAALWAASEPPARIAAVVSRGGRPDLAGPRLSAVQAPTLLIVGSLDHEVLELNRKAKAMMRCPNQLAVVQGATHLFEEPGTLAAAAILARDWFAKYLLTVTEPTSQE